MSSTKKPTSAKDLRIFAIIVTVGVLLLAYLRSWWPWLTPAMLAFLALGLAFPPCLKVPHALWMKLAQMLGYINLRVILFLTYALIVTPVALVFKMMGRDKMKLKKSPAPSYWEDYDAHPKTVERYRKLF